MFLRDIRHHDDHSLLNPHSFENNYLPVTVREIRREDYAPGPWTPNQARFANARQPVRILKGHPGSGKTTALWHAADSTGAERVLYVTYSRDLAALAQDYFDRFCSSHRQFHVVTFSSLLRELVSSDAALIPESESRQQFIRDLTPFSRILGAWSTHQAALYDELHAHLAGDALPLNIGRFAACTQPRVPDKAYKERRTRSLGPAPVAAALDLANRMERDQGSLASRYFPELALAWKALERLRPSKGEPHVNSAWLNFDCIAVDEVQDLTPLEAFVLVQLAAILNIQHRHPVPFLLAGDEAQTVRPTDFEWAWMNDLLHSQLAVPAEFKLSANLRSPRHIAELVNRVWDLYGLIEKQERPSGTGYAEIDDDATDQILHCTGAPGPELDELLVALSAREGLAIISLDETVPAYIPASVKPAVLTAREAKGLDFHSVCILDGGRQIERILKVSDRFNSVNDIEDLRKRLAIDQLRVALSRPTERLIWLDTNPTDSVLEQSARFLNGNAYVLEKSISNCVPSALLKTLEEEQLDLEERIQRCQQDARQYLGVRPEMAWSRAQQAVALLGAPGSPAAITDEAVRRAAHLTLSEVCFVLGFRKTKFPPELGRPHLFHEAAHAAAAVRNFALSNVIVAIGKVQEANLANRLEALLEMAATVPRSQDAITPWIRVEIAPKVNAWVEELETALHSGQNAAILIKTLPNLYEVLGLPDATVRLEKLRKRAIQLLMKDNQYRAALDALYALPERNPKLEGACHEGLKQFREAAECYRTAGSLKEALNCYRSIPDIGAALELIKQMGDHPAAESLQWIGRLQTLVQERPANFTKTVNAAEKKQLEQLLEQSLGVTRARPPRKTAVKKAATPKKRVVRKRPPEPDYF